MRPQFRKASDRFLLHKVPHHLHIELVEEKVHRALPQQASGDSATHVIRLMAMGFSLALWCCGQRYCSSVGGCGEIRLLFFAPQRRQMQMQMQNKNKKQKHACTNDTKFIFFVAPSRCEQYSFYVLSCDYGVCCSLLLWSVSL